MFRSCHNPLQDMRGDLWFPPLVTGQRVAGLSYKYIQVQLAGIYSTHQVFSNCPLYLFLYSNCTGPDCYLRTKKEKVHSPLSQLVCCCLCIVMSGPLPSTCPTSSACLPEELYKHRPHDEDCQSTCEHLRIRKQCILSKQSRSCKLECRILIM